MAGINTEAWIQDIQESLFQNNEFMNFAINDSQFVNNEIVHIPQSGSKPGISINEGTVPKTVLSRTDTDYTYNLDELWTDPILIRQLTDAQFLSYDKRMSVMRQHIETLREGMGDRTFFRWADSIKGSTAGGTVRTQGVASDSALAPGAGGTRNAIDKKTLTLAKAALAKQNVPQTDGKLWLGLPSDMYYQLIEVEENISRANEFGQGGAGVLPTGAINRILGCNVYIRPRVNVYDVNADIKAVGAVGAADDNLGALLWHEDFVSVAEGSIDVMSDFGDGGNGKPEYGGGIVSAMVYYGAESRRSDHAGLVEIVQQ